MLSQSNIAVDADGRARIMDPRLAMVITGSQQTTSDQHVKSRQWSAPEILGGGATSKEADIFSFAMVMIEVHHGRYTVVKLWLTFPSY